MREALKLVLFLILVLIPFALAVIFVRNEFMYISAMGMPIVFLQIDKIKKLNR